MYGSPYTQFGTMPYFRVYCSPEVSHDLLRAANHQFCWKCGTCLDRDLAQEIFSVVQPELKYAIATLMKASIQVMKFAEFVHEKAPNTVSGLTNNLREAVSDVERLTGIRP